MTQKRLWIVGASLSVALSGGLFLFQAKNWADPTPPTPPAPLTMDETAALKAKNLMVDADLIRVGISDDSMTGLEYPSATISATGPFRIVTKDTDQLVSLNNPNQAIRISKNGSGFWLFVEGAGNLGPFPGTLKVEPLTSDTRLRVTSVTRKGIIPSYRGIFEITPGYSGPDKFTVVNVLPMQDYLKAVVPNELPYSYGYEAVKAQAVAARNYAIHPREKPWPQFDICDSQYCQAYYGSNTENPGTTKALERTQGLVALYQGEPILALYSSSHGGYSENYENAFSDVKTNKFPATPIPYLKGAPDEGKMLDLSTDSSARAFYMSKADSYDVLSPLYRWQRQWTRPEMEAAINQNLAEASKDKTTSPFISPLFPAGASIGQLKGLTVTQRGVSGKVMKLTIEGSKGTWTLEKEFVIRRVMKNAGKFLPSANVVFDLPKDAKGNIIAIKAYGGGFGHGVGMSQLGASYMSKHGSSFVDILDHYYKGIALGSIPIVASKDQGMKTDFYIDDPKGKLFVENSGKSLVRLVINDREVVIKPGPNARTIQDIQSYLKPNQLNSLKILPLTNAGETVKAWVEVFAADTDVQSASTSSLPAK